MKFNRQHHCLFCGAKCKSHYRVCDPCYQDLPWVGSHCIYCSRPICADQNSICGQCITQKHPYNNILTPFYYQPPISTFITSLKFKGEFNLAKVLANLMLPALTKHYGDHVLPEILIPIPLHNKRLYDRGFNQCIEVGKYLSRELGVTLSRRTGIRVQHTPAQHLLKMKKRKNNLKNAFAVNIKDKKKRVVVLDDVITSGTTINSFCYELKKHGIDHIDVWCIAVTIKNLL